MCSIKPVKCSTAAALEQICWALVLCFSQLQATAVGLLLCLHDSRLTQWAQLAAHATRLTR